MADTTWTRAPASRSGARLPLRTLDTECERPAESVSRIQCCQEQRAVDDRERCRQDGLRCLGSMMDLIAGCMFVDIFLLRAVNTNQGLD